MRLLSIKKITVVVVFAVRRRLLVRTNMDTLFGHLAMRFGSHPENLATEGLYFVLSRSGEARRLFLRFLEQAGAPLPGDLIFQTQAADEAGAIPDLVGRDTQGAEVAIVEAKFWAGLTERQPVAYLDRLPPSFGLLVFVAPAKRFESLWPQLLARCRDGGKGIERADAASPDWRVARITGGRRLALTSWRAMLEALHIGLQQAGETAEAADIAQLQGLAGSMDADAFLPLTSEELTSTLGRRVLQFCDLVDSAVERLAGEKLADTKGYKSGGGRGSYYRPFRLHQTGCYLSFDAAKWKQYGRPIWLCLHGSDWKPSSAVGDALSPLGLQTPPCLIIVQSGPHPGAYVPIDLPTQAEYDAVLAVMLGQIRRVAELVKQVPPVGGPVLPPIQESE